MGLDVARMALDALRAHWGRSMLTVSSITVGAFAIVLAASLAEAGLSTLMRSVEDLGGARLVLISPKAAERAEKKATMLAAGFDVDDLTALTRDVPHLERATLYAGLGARDAASDGGRTSRPDLVAAGPGFFEVFRMRIARGRALTDEDERAAARVCVVGPKLANKAWSGEALEGHLTLAGLRCRVVGVLTDNERWGMNFGFDWNYVVLLPHRTASDHFRGVREDSSLTLLTDRPSSNEIVKRTVNARLVRERAGVDNFTIYDLGGFVDRFQATFSIMKLVAGALGAIALVIGGVGVMNMMLVSVSERTREIGIRKALGATPTHLSAQFLTEATLLSSLGGGLGAILGVLVALGSAVLIRSALPHWVSAVSTPAILSALLLSLGAGVLFGFLPARRAARLDPVEAMRQ